MFLRFEFRICYLPVATNKTKELWRSSYDFISYRKAKEKALEMSGYYPLKDGWEVSIEKEVTFIFQNINKVWKSKNYDRPYLGRMGK